MMWIDLLKAWFDVPSGYALAAVVGDEDHRKMWQRFNTARSAAAWPGGLSTRVDKAEQLVPGSTRWLTHPMWHILRGGPVSQQLIDEGLWSFSPERRARFFQCVDGELVRLRKPLQLIDLTTLFHVSDLDAIATVVLLMAEAEIVCSPILREAAFEAYEEIQPWFADRPEYQRIFPYLFTRIDSRFQRWIFTDIRRRVDVRMRWDKEFWAIRKGPFQIKHPKLIKELDEGPPYVPEHIKAIAPIRRGSLLQLYLSPTGPSLYNQGVHVPEQI